MDVHGPRASVEVVAPDLGEQLGSGEHPTRPLDQEPEELELLVGEVEEPPGYSYLVGVGVHRHGSEPEHRLARPAGSPGEHRHANGQLRAGRPGVDELIGDLCPREPLQVLPGQDNHGGEISDTAARRKHRQEAEGVLGVVLRIRDEQGRGQLAEVGDGFGGERLGLDVQPERLQGGEGLSERAVGEEHHASHDQPSVTDGPDHTDYPWHAMPRSTLTYRSARFDVATMPFRVIGGDGVSLAGDRLGSGPVAMVFCHGFLGWHRKPRLVRFQEALAKRLTVYGFDFRGHGDSEGSCAYGALEHLDVEAVVRQARADGFQRVVTFGGSMGGIAVLRHGALLGGVDAVVAVSTPARWDGHESEAVRRLTWLTSGRLGRRALRAAGLRASPTFERVEDPVDVVGKIAPTPLVLVHGRDDHFFDEEQAWALYRAANQPKRLLLASRFGHAENGFTPAFADLVTAAALEAVGR